MNKTFINPFAGVAKTATHRGGDLTTQNLFKENNPHGYFTRKELLDYVAGKSEYQQKKLLLLFDLLADGHAVVNPPIPGPDRSGDDVIWATLSLNGQKQNLRFESVNWLAQMLMDRYRGELPRFMFEPEVLAEELQKVQE